LKTRLFVDFRSDDGYDRSVGQLLRHFYNAQAAELPPLGPRPSFPAQDAAPVAAPDLSVAPRKWILVAGTGKENKFTAVERETAARLGRALADGSFGLVTGGWPGVDEFVGRAFADEVARRRLPLENLLVQVVAQNRLPRFPAGDLILVKAGKAEWTEGIRRADAVVLIGGFGGTLTTGRWAAERRKPVFPLADTDRDAKQLYVEMLRDWDRVGPPGLDRSTFQRMARPAPAVVDDLMEVLRAV
jgi:hypothetical protein